MSRPEVALTKRTLSWKPSPIQELLLSAALGDGAGALDAYRQWRQAAHAPLDAGSRRLLPLLARNTSRLGVDDERATEWRALAMDTWAANQILFHEAGTLISQLARAGLETRVLKGAALAMLAYDDPGLRPMTDVDILVRESDARAAMRVMRENGWTSHSTSPGTQIPYRHSLDFRNDRGGCCDLHWRLLCDGRQDVGDDDVWESPVRFDLGGAPAHALAASDQLMHACVHATTWNNETAARWVADALALVRASHLTIDWSRVVTGASRRGLASPLKDTLLYLEELLPGTVPADTRAHLSSAPVSLYDRVIGRSRTSPIQMFRTARRLQYWLRRWRVSESRGVPAKLREFRAYLRGSDEWTAR